MSADLIPMIEVIGLRKEYPGCPAVGDVSFTVPAGGIVGLLGPNGAGKSTILKILSGYMPGTHGTVLVAGFDVFHQSAEVRKRIGYMPENNPLHLDMRVKDYLTFRGRLKGMGVRETRDRVAAVLDQCDLLGVDRRVIGQLSKGYSQRVGLADALVAKPELILLDEPTIGLDPNQIRSVRELILSLGCNYTVLLSTHILSEVEITCSHVIILNQGKVLASGTKQNLLDGLGGGKEIHVELAAQESALREILATIEGLEHFDLKPVGEGYLGCVLKVRPGFDLRPVLFEMARGRGWVLRELTQVRQTLEDAFVRVIRDHSQDQS